MPCVIRALTLALMGPVCHRAVGWLSEVAVGCSLIYQTLYST